MKIFESFIGGEGPENTSLCSGINLFCIRDRRLFCRNLLRFTESKKWHTKQKRPSEMPHDLGKDAAPTSLGGSSQFCLVFFFLSSLLQVKISLCMISAELYQFYSLENTHAKNCKPIFITAGIFDIISESENKRKQILFLTCCLLDTKLLMFVHF